MNTVQAPAGSSRSMSRSEGLQYLALIQVLFQMSTIQAERGKISSWIQVIAGVLEQGWKPKHISEPHLLPEMAAAIDKIISEF